MDTEFLIKIILALFAIPATVKFFYDMKVSRKSHLRDEYRFANEFLIDVKNKNTHPFTIEKGYQAIAGTTAVNTEEIAYILSLNNSSKCLKNFVFSKHLMEILKTEGDLKLEFKKKYRNKWSRRWRKALYLPLYFVLAFYALSPLVLYNLFELSFSEVLLILVLTLLTGVPTAFSAMRALVRIERGEALISNQDSHTKAIVEL